MGTESHQAGEGARQRCSWARILHPGTPQEKAARGQAGPRPLLTKQLHSPLQSCCGNGRKSLLENPGWEMKPHPGTPLSVNPQHPQADAALLAQQSTSLYYRFSEVSDDRPFERSSCSPSSLLCSKFFCALYFFCSKHIYRFFTLGKATRSAPVGSFICRSHGAACNPS